LDLIDPFDHLSTRRACPWGLAECTEEAMCPMHTNWQRVLEAVVQMLARTHLSDLAVESDGWQPLMDPTASAALAGTPFSKTPGAPS
jgi:DNA-binding IscR family transcriptional regulator